MPTKRHTDATLPHAEDQPEEPLPNFHAVMEEHGPKDDQGKPTMQLPTFVTPEYIDWMPGVLERVERKADERAPQIAKEAAEAVETAQHEPWTLAADKPLSGDYTLSWERPPTEEPIKVPSERVDRPAPTPRARRVQE